MRPTERAIRNAQDEAIYKAPSVLMTRRRAKYTDARRDSSDTPIVNLKVSSNSMTWGDWVKVLDALDRFVDDWGARVLNFRVVDRNHPGGSMGFGYLESADDSDSDDDF